MTARIVASASGAARRDAVRAFVRESNVPVIVVAARLENARALAAEVALERGAMLETECVTLDGLAARLSARELARSGLSIATTLAVDAAAARALVTLASALPRMGPLCASPGMARAIGRTLDELWAADLGASHVAAFDDELARVAAHVELALRDEKKVPRARVIERAVEAVRAGALGATRVAFLDVAITTRLGADLARSIASIADTLFAVPSADARTLAALGGIEVVVREASRGPAVVAAELFGRERGAAHASLETIVARSEAAEAAEITRRVLSLAREGTPLHRIAIVVRRPELARGAIESTFQAAGIALSQRRAARRPDPNGRALLALLTCAVEGLSARAFSAYLSFGVMPMQDGQPPAASANANVHAFDDDDDEIDDEPLPDTLRAPRRWESLIVEAAVVGGDPARWRRRLAGLRASLERSKAEIDRRGGESAGAQRTLDEVTALERFALPLLDELAALPPRASLTTYARMIGELATRALARPARALSVLGELTPSAAGELSLADVVRVLAQKLGSIETRPASTGVQLATPDELRGASFDVVILPWLVERVFPARVPEDPLLADATRRALSPDLEDAHARAAKERLALALAVGAAEHRVIALASIASDGGRARVPSVYFVELLGRALGRVATGADVAVAMDAAVASVTSPERAARPSERDLATIEALRSRPRDEARGRAAHIAERNAFLRSALRRFYRFETPELGRSDGLVLGKTDPRDALAASAPSMRPYSATALERLAKCPLQFHLQAIARLEPREEPTPIETIDPLVRGSIFHEAQFHTLLALREQKHLPLAADRLPAALEVLARVTSALRSELVERLVPAIPRIFHAELDAIEADLREWLTRLSTNTDWEPRYFELAFGLPGDDGRDPASRDAPATLDEGIRLRGAIDLVEAHRTSGALRATDHKTGSSYPIRDPGPLVVRGGQTLQPVLYALALTKLFPTATVAGGRLWYCTTKGRFEERTVPLDDEARAATKAHVAALMEATTKGLMPALPIDGACAFCDVRLACGPRAEEHASRLDTRSIEKLLPALTQLRRRA
jgi:RecB family exonuclease